MKGIGHTSFGTLMMYVELTITPYTLRLAIEPHGHSSSIVVLRHDGVEAVCTYNDGLPALLEGLCGKRWWQDHRAEVEQQLAQRGLSIELP